MDVLNDVFSVFAWVVLAPLVLLHASQSLINFVERPDIEVLHTAHESPLLVKEVHTNASDGQLVAILEYKDDIHAEPCLNRKLAVPQVSKISPLVEVDIVSKKHFLDHLCLH